MDFDLSRVRERIDEGQPAPRARHEDVALVAVGNDRGGERDAVELEDQPNRRVR